MTASTSIRQAIAPSLHPEERISFVLRDGLSALLRMKEMRVTKDEGTGPATLRDGPSGLLRMKAPSAVKESDP